MNNVRKNVFNQNYAQRKMNIQSQQANSYTEEDNFVLQVPNNNNSENGTKFIFECNMGTGNTNNVDIKNNTEIVSDTVTQSQDNFILNKPETAPVDNIKKYNNSENKNNRFDNLNNLPSATDITKSISKIANMIRDSLKQKNIYNKINHGKIHQQDFYIKLSNSIWKSLLQVCGIVKGDTPDNFDIPAVTNETPYLDTWRFFDRIYHDTRVSLEKDPLTAISGYKETFGVSGGITNDWIPMLIATIKVKLNISVTDILVITKIVEKDWCYTECNNSEDIDNTLETDEPSILTHESIDVVVPVINFDKANRNGNIFDSSIATQSFESSDDVNYIDEDEEYNDYDDGEYEDEEYNEGEECDDEEDEEDNEVLSVDIQTDEGITESIIAITAWNGTSMMLYADMNNINIQSGFADRPWGWLRHFIPNAMIITDEPEIFLECNQEIEEIKFATLRKTKMVTGEENDESTIIGLYYIDPDLNDMDDQTLQQLSTLIECNVMGAHHLSHLERTLQMDKLIVDEDSILECIGDWIASDNEPDEDDNNNTDDNDAESIIAFAASIAADSNNQTNNIDQDVDQNYEELPEEDTTENDSQNENDNRDEISNDESINNELSTEPVEILPTDNECVPENTIGEYIQHKHNNSDDMVFAPIRKDNVNSKYHNAE